MKRAISKNLEAVSIHYFQDAGACLDSIDLISPHIIITDYAMPGMNGIDFLKELREKAYDIPVIMTTGQGDEKVAVQAMKLGAWDYLVKSVDFFSLLPRVIEKVAREWDLKESLRESERLLQDLTEGVSDWIWEVDSQGRYTYSNPNAEEIAGYSPAELVGKGFYDLLVDDDSLSLWDRLRRVRTDGMRVSGLESRFVHKLGHEIVVETNAVPFFDKEGNLRGYRGVHRNISQRKRAETALQESEEKFRSIFEKSPIGIGIYDPEGRLKDANRSFLNIFGLSDLEEVKRFRLFANPGVPDDTRARLRQGENVKFETELDFGQIMEMGLCETTRSGNVELDVLVTQLGLEDGEAFRGYLVQARDITAHKQAEDHVRRLSQQLIKAHEVERKRISCDLHDHLAQDLSTLKIGLDTLFDDLPDVRADKRERVSGLSQIAQQTITAVRDLAYGLRPASLDQLGLVQTVLQLCEEFSVANGIKVDFFSAGMDEITLDFDTEISLYRLIQEGLTNIRKHADATTVVIRLVESFPNIILRIEDNGKGFDVQDRLGKALAERRMGIRSMEERAALLDGKIKLGSRPGLGTKIVVEVPYKEKTFG